MKKILISILILISFLSYSEVREIAPLGVNNEQSSTAITEAAENTDSQVAENVTKIYEYRPEILREIDRQIAIPANRGILKSLYAQYNNELNAYLESVSYNSDVIFFLANQYMMMNDYARANKIFSMDNRDLKNVFGAATTYRFMGKNEEAVQKYNEAISMNSSFSESYLGRALANRNMDNYDSAINDLNKYISMTSSLEGYAALGDIYFKLGRNKEAYNIVAAGLGKYPNSELLKTLMRGISKSGERN